MNCIMSLVIVIDDIMLIVDDTTTTAVDEEVGSTKGPGASVLGMRMK